MIPPKPFRLFAAPALAVALFVAASAPVSAAEGRVPKTYTIEQFIATTSMTGASFSADESQILYSSNETGIWNVYSRPVTGGAAKAWTASKTDNNFAVAFFPKDDRILITRDEGGNELNHLFVRALDGKETDLTPGKKLKATFAGFAHDNGSFYATTNERDPHYIDLYRYDAVTYERQMVYRDTVGLQFGAVSDDGSWVALQRTNSSSDGDVFLYDTRAGALRLVTPHEGMVNNVPAAFDPSSNALYYLTDDGGEFTFVMRYDLATEAKSPVVKDAWDIGLYKFSRDGKYVVTGINADAATVVRVQEVATGEQLPLPKLADADVTGTQFSNSGSKLAFYMNGDRSPSNLYVLALEKGAKPVRLTESLSKEIDAADLVDSKVVRFKSFDGLEIPNLLWVPQQASPQAKAPALVWVHGGPGDQTRKGYSGFLQYLVNHGYVVLGINNRGSAGYGRTFYNADNKKHGREPLWDCVEGKKYLASLPYVDANRIGIIGGSYGGYMVLAALAFKPEEFVVGVDLFGISNWIRTIESIPPYWAPIRKALYTKIGDPVADRALLEETSPLRHADQIKKPLLVLQGANDPRVLQAESDDIVAAVKKNGVPVEYIVFPEEGHGFSKKKDQITGYGAVLKFCDRYLRGAPEMANTP